MPETAQLLDLNPAKSYFFKLFCRLSFHIANFCSDFLFMPGVIFFFIQFSPNKIIVFDQNFLNPI